jgi:hypothetical protein
MPHSLARLSASASSHRNLSSAVFITNIAESDFSVHTAQKSWITSPTIKLGSLMTPRLLTAMLSPLCTSPRNGLGRRPVCDPVSVAEDLFTEMRCELDHYRPTRHAEQLDADVDNCST